VPHEDLRILAKKKHRPKSLIIILIKYLMLSRHSCNIYTKVNNSKLLYFIK
jgi:hypothetical protein